MKVAILTIPIHSNFGYIMQLYALQKAIEKAGHEAYTIQLKLDPKTFKQRITYFAKALISKYLLHRQATPFRKFPNQHQMDVMDANTWDFVNHYCKLTRYITSVDKLSELAEEYDVFVVGSDQVWRRQYSIDIPSFFFSFLPDGKKRIAYAASFGISKNDYGEELTEKCRSLLTKFSAVGVREKTAVKLCEDVFGVNAEQVLDPTLLLMKDDYVKLIEDNKVDKMPTKPFLLLYVIDSAPEKTTVAEKMAKEKDLEVYRIKPSDFKSVGSRHLKDCIYPHISTWLYAFSHASYIVTDSFHGTVFSIIFEKPFLTFGNVSRGLDRMVTLLDICGLSDRFYGEQFHDKETDYNIVSERLDEERKKSMSFLASQF